MKKHAIIPIFIPHRGCPNDCVFCNQRKITAHQNPVGPQDVARTAETWLSTLEGQKLETIELAFFGGSFTGIPLEEQTAFLQVAKRYKDAGRIQKIHLSTRPDYITPEILDNLKRWGADVIELGVQSFDEEVLRASGRGHNAACVYESSRMIQDYGFTLGIQLMIGLPGDTLEKDIFSAREAVKTRPAIARLYPTVVIEDTALYDMYRAGIYSPLTEKDAVQRTKEMYRILDDAGIRIIRVGLKSSDIIAGSSKETGTFHPAFRQLVEGRIARESLEEQLLALCPKLREQSAAVPDFSGPAVCFVSSAGSRNNLFGHKSANREYFAKKYPGCHIKYLVDTQLGLSLPEGRYLVLPDEQSGAYILSHYHNF